MITVKNFATLLVVGTWLLVTLSACENSKHAEIMSTEDLRARAQMATAPDTDTDTERAQGGIPFDGESVGQESLGLSENIYLCSGTSSESGIASQRRGCDRSRP